MKTAPMPALRPPPRRAVVIGRAPECDVVLADPSVSARHARLSRDGDLLVIEDLGSANGLWVKGQKVRTAKVRAGDDVLLGGVAFPWSDPAIAALARDGNRASATMQLTMVGRAFVCGRCGARGMLPRGIKSAELQCRSCGTMLELGGTSASRSLVSALVSFTIVALSLAALVAVFLWREPIAEALRALGKTEEATQLPISGPWEPPVGSPQERAIRDSGAPERVVAAIDPSHATTRNLAARVAARDQGTFHVGQVASLWAHVRQEWRYVNDPRGAEYFARASETIDNGLVGDCDDFAILMSALVEAIGGDARVVMSDGDRGGHAYAEVCVPGEPEQVLTDLRAHYRRVRVRARVTQLSFRSDATCRVWLNLDWNAATLGGPYGREDWAVAIHPDGKTETLAPAAPDAPAPAAATSTPSAR